MALAASHAFEMRFFMSLTLDSMRLPRYVKSVTHLIGPVDSMSGVRGVWDGGVNIATVFGRLMRSPMGNAARSIACSSCWAFSVLEDAVAMSSA